MKRGIYYRNGEWGKYSWKLGNFFHEWSWLPGRLISPYFSRRKHWNGVWLSTKDLLGWLVWPLENGVRNLRRSLRRKPKKWLTAETLKLWFDYCLWFMKKHGKLPE